MGDVSNADHVMFPAPLTRQPSDTRALVEAIQGDFARSGPVLEPFDRFRS